MFGNLIQDLSTISALTFVAAWILVGIVQVIDGRGNAKSEERRRMMKEAIRELNK